MRNKIRMFKRIIIIIGILSGFILNLSASEIIIPQDKKSTPAAAENKQDIPDWVKRTNFGIEAGTGQRPKYFFETIQPLLGTQEEDLVFFNQSRISERSSRPVYNLGLGLRRVFSDKWLLGLNSFYDYQDLHKHSRGGVGFEAISDLGIESRINTYIGISRKRLVGEDSANEYFEKVANGFDWELGAPLPYLPFLKIYGGGNWYTFAFTSFSPKDLLNDFKGSKTAYPKVNLRDKALDRVVRDFDITVIKSTKSKATGLTVEGGRA